MSPKLSFILSFLFLSLSVFAECDIRDLTVTRTACNQDGEFSVIINFIHEDVGDSGFRIQGNGINHGEFNYDDLPVTIDGLAGNCTTEWEFVVRDIDSPTCAEDFGLGIVCCDSNCDYEIVDFATGECINGGFSMMFDLEYSNILEVGVDVYINGNFTQTYDYEEFPVLIEDITPLNDRENQLVICDNGNETCCDTLFFESPCACSIKNLKYRGIECNDVDSTYFLKIDFETNMVSDSFQFGGNGTFFGKYAYADLPLAIGPADFHTDTAYYLVVDNKNSFCFEEIIVAPVDTCDFKCGITNATAEVGMCNDNEDFFVTIKFDAKNPGLEGFSIAGNGVVYGDDYEYGQEEYVIGPLSGDCETIYEFIIKDNELNDCKTEIVLTETICCKSCNITELNVEYGCAENRVNQLVVNFNYDYSLDSMFNVKVNDMVFGPYHYDEIPLSIALDLPGNEEIRVDVMDLSSPDCRRIKEILPNCGELPCGEFVNIFTEYGDCLENNTFYLDIDFELEGTHSDSFYIGIFDQIMGPYSHGENFYRLGPFESNCKRIIFKLIDAERPDCFKVYEIDEIKCCETCEIELANVEVKCEDGEAVGFSIKVNGNDKSTKFKFELAGEEYGPFEYNESHFVEVNLENGNYEFYINDVEFPDCRIEVGLDVDCGDVFPCSFTEVSINAVNCTDETFEFMIDFDLNQNPNFLFDLLINGDLKGTSSYSLLPISSTKLNRNDGGPWNIKIIDRERDCVLEVKIEEEVCETGLDETLFDQIVARNNGRTIWVDGDNTLGMVQYKLINGLGQVIIADQWMSSNELKIELSTLANGIYFLVLEKDGLIQTHKVGKL